MKKNFSLLMIAALFLFFAASCSTDYDANPTGPDGRNPFQGQFSAEINGVSFNADVKYFNDTTGNDIRYVSISATEFPVDKDTLKSKTISLTIPNYEGPKTYYTNAGSSSVVYTHKDSAFLKTYMNAPGDTLAAITITGDQSSWVGTFQLMAVSFDLTGIGTDTIYINDGKFDIPK